MRLKNSIYNILTSIGSQLVLVLVNFVSRKIFINILGAELVGLNSLFANVITVLSLAELGIGSVLVVKLYKPIVQEDKEKIKSLMDMYKKAYRIIAIVVFVLAMLLLPFLKTFVNVSEDLVVNIYIVYIMFVINNISTYFFAYKKSMLNADQKNYIITIVHTIIMIAINVIQIIVVLITKNYYIYLSIQILLNITENIIIAKYVDKKYPYLKEKATVLSKVEQKDIITDVKAMMLHKVGNVVVSSTDNIIISKFLGVYWVGIYSNYYMLMNAVVGIISHLYTSVVASVGNLNVEASREKMYSIFKKVNFFTFWIYAFCTTTLLILMTPFIEDIWLGTTEYSLGTIEVLLIALMFYTAGIRRACILFKDSTGLFRYDKYKPIVSVIVNLVVSIALAKVIGLSGVFLGTILSSGCICFFWEAWVVYKYLLKRPLKEYLLMWGKYTLLTMIIIIITFVATQFSLSNVILTFVMKVIIVTIVPNVIIILIYRKTGEYKYFWNIGKKILKKIGMSRNEKKQEKDN